MKTELLNTHCIVCEEPIGVNDERITIHTRIEMSGAELAEHVRHDLNLLSAIAHPECAAHYLRSVYSDATVSIIKQ